jgi:hypothetical protein
MHFTLRHEQRDGDDGGSSPQVRVVVFPSLFSPPFLYSSTHAFAALTTNGRFLSLQTCSACVQDCYCVHAPFAGAFRIQLQHTVHIHGYRHISAFFFTLSSLTARPSYLGTR